MASSSTSSLTKTVALVGGQGWVGFKLALLLADDPKVDLRLIVRQASLESNPGKKRKTDLLESMGASVVFADLADTSSLVPAFRGTDCVVLMIHAGDDANVQLHDNVIAAMKEAEAPYLIPAMFTVDFRRIPKEKYPVYTARKQIMEHVEASGLDWTGILCGGFVETLFAPFFTRIDAQDPTKASCHANGELLEDVCLTRDVALTVQSVIHDPDAKNKHIAVSQCLSWRQELEQVEKGKGSGFKYTFTDRGSVEQLGAETAKAWADKEYVTATALTYALSILTGDVKTGDDIRVDPKERWGWDLMSLEEWARNGMPLMPWPSAEDTGEEAFVEINPFLSKPVGFPEDA